MTHEHDPNHPQRHGQDQHAPEQSSDPSSPGSTPAFADPNSQGIQPRGRQYPEPDQTPLPGLEPQSPPTLVGFQGPVPPPNIIEEYNQISPGAGTRILDDAHEDTMEDRRITREAFEHTKHEAWVRIAIAAIVLLMCVTGIFLCLALFEPPESIAGATLFSIGAIASVIKEVMNGSRSQNTRDGGDS